MYDDEAHRRLAVGWGASIEAALDAIVELGALSGARVGLNLHTHLEGWVRPETAADLAASMGVPTPAGGWERGPPDDASRPT